ncbi:monooxygenase [Wilcoxina mikolae CBS 423.85]|nr:monooxygenase [Wilcoxina mikolae CBS 423.85]
MSTSQPSPRFSSTIVCIGAGMSGIALGAHLKLSYGFTDVHFYEREASIGGTWWLNTYPGCACDVPSALYSFSFAQNKEWTKLYPSSREIKAYADKVAADYDIPVRTTFRTEVVRVEWIDEKSRWLVYLRNWDSGDEYTHDCKVLFNAGGLLVDPNIPQYPGQERFEGVTMHSARWGHSVSLEGKKVAVIGNGSTAAQIVPAIAPQVASMVQFIRSKHWIQPSVRLPYTPSVRWFLKNIPFAQALHRFVIFLGAEADYPLQNQNAYSDWRRGAKMKVVENYMRKKAPAEYHNLLIPDFPISCKRRIHDPENSYLGCLGRHNVTLTDSPILELTPTAIRTTTKDYPIDVIIYATGFRTNAEFLGMEVVGREGTTLHEHWKSFGGAGSYNSMANHYFPNYFMILGPNSATGHTSALMASENTILYALKVLKPVLEGYASSVEPKREAERRYIERVQDALKDTVFNAGCTTWYKNKETGWNASIYPWSQFQFYFMCLFVNEADWNITYTRKPPHSLTSKLMVFGVFAATFAAVLSGFFSGAPHGGT